jgi:hypothetical protein
VRGNPKLAPERLRLALVAIPGDKVQLEAELSYPNRDEAAAALKVVERERRKLAGDPLTMLTLRMLGLAATLDRLVVEVREETRVYASVELTYAQVRAILGHVRAALAERDRRPAPPASAPKPIPSAPAPPPSEAR